MATQGQASPDYPLTVVISRQVKSGKETEFEALSAEMTTRASHFPGYLGATMFRPASADDPEYRIVFKFAGQAALSDWEQSPERLEVLQQIEQQTLNLGMDQRGLKLIM